MRPPGNLYVVATPIGNIEDITLRALRIFREVKVIACEDTRKTGLLLKRLGIERRKDQKFVAYHEHNEASAAEGLLKVLLQGEDVALVTNAGTPLISDPGFRLVREARRAGIKVVPVPGPCALVAALSASGLPTDRFTFFGFLPPKEGRRKALLRRIFEAQKDLLGTSIFFVPARSIGKVLGELEEVEKDCEVLIAREMTKVFEEFIWGSPGECLAQIREKSVKGEITLLVSARRKE